MSNIVLARCVVYSDGEHVVYIHRASKTGRPSTELFDFCAKGAKEFGITPDVPVLEYGKNIDFPIKGPFQKFKITVEKV